MELLTVNLKLQALKNAVSVQMGSSLSLEQDLKAVLPALVCKIVQP